MPGPMSNPNGVEQIFNWREDGELIAKSISQLTGEERAYLARRKRLTTGKTAKKRKGGAS
jgi:hypothetical protein